MLSRACLSLKSRGIKLSVERGGEGAEHGIPSTHCAVLRVLGGLVGSSPSSANWLGHPG